MRRKWEGKRGVTFTAAEAVPGGFRSAARFVAVGAEEEESVGRMREGKGESVPGGGASGVDIMGYTDKDEM